VEAVISNLSLLGTKGPTPRPPTGRSSIARRTPATAAVAPSRHLSPKSVGRASLNPRDLQRSVSMRVDRAAILTEAAKGGGGVAVLLSALIDGPEVGIDPIHCREGMLQAS
jgi:hypothetical protein